jgi:hypothetical protein
MRGWWANRIGNDRGAELIEVALMLPLLLLISVSIFEFGRAYQTEQVLTNAAREGARVAILPNPAPGSIEARVRTYMTNGQLPAANIDASTITVDPAVPIDMGAAGTATGSQITIFYPFQFMVLQPVANLVTSGSLLGSSITMSATAVMRNEQ